MFCCQKNCILISSSILTTNWHSYTNPKLLIFLHTNYQMNINIFLRKTNTIILRRYTQHPANLYCFLLNIIIPCIASTVYIPKSISAISSKITLSSFEHSFLYRMNYAELMLLLYVSCKQTLLKYETFHFAIVLN